MAELDELADELELLDTGGHNLRPTAERHRLRADRRRAGEIANIRRTTIATQTEPLELTDEKKFVPSANLSNTNSVSVGIGDSCIWESTSKMAAIVTQLARFCGEVPTSNPEKTALESYDVTRWLADVDARISSQGITGDAAMIKEAWVLVNADHGNARQLLRGALFSEITTYAAFKAECLLTWKPKDRADLLVNL